VGAGVVVTVVIMSVQHVALQQCPFAQTVFAGWLLYPEGQVKLAHVGGGVVVTVVVMGGGVVVTVVVIKEQQHVIEGPLVTGLGGPTAQGLGGGALVQTVFAGRLLYPEGQVKLAHVGGGVDVTVVTIKVQHVYLQQCPFAQTVFAGRLLYPEGQVKLAQVGGGVVVTVVTRSQHTCGQHFGSFALPHMMTPAFWA
jgi:hypothetical protein